MPLSPGEPVGEAPFHPDWCPLSHLFQNGSKDGSLDMLGTDIWAANTFEPFR